jgi:hypothetical protein
MKQPALLFVIMSVFLYSGCQEKSPLEPEMVTRVDTLTVTNTDTVFADTVFVPVKDTIVVHDTVTVIIHDTVTVTVYDTVYLPAKPLSETDSVYASSIMGLASIPEHLIGGHISARWEDGYNTWVSWYFNPGALNTTGRRLVIHWQDDNGNQHVGYIGDSANRDLHIFPMPGSYGYGDSRIDYFFPNNDGFTIMSPRTF